MSYRPMVRTGSDPAFYGNGLRYATAAEAQASADELMGRWLLVVETRVDPSDDPVTHHWDATTQRSVRISEAHFSDDGEVGIRLRGKAL